jgi:hypothetical protein
LLGNGSFGIYVAQGRYQVIDYLRPPVPASSDGPSGGDRHVSITYIDILTATVDRSRMVDMFNWIQVLTTVMELLVCSFILFFKLHTFLGFIYICIICVVLLEGGERKRGQR